MGKRVRGRKRHILVETEGLLLKEVVHPADLQERDGGRSAKIRLPPSPRMAKLWVDADYRGGL